MSTQQAPGPLSGSQEWALEWMASNPPAGRNTWRDAGISSTTMRSLVKRGLAQWLLMGQTSTTVWRCTDAGRAAISKERSYG
jgi:hypothetical protein